jgi:predicted Zn-dependent peptidase
MWFIYASGEPDRMAEVWEVCQREARGLADAVTQDDLDRLRAKIRTGVTIGGERPTDRMQRLGRLRCVRNDYLSLEDELANLARVTLTDVRDVLAAFPMEHAMVGTLLPAEG